MSAHRLRRDEQLLGDPAVRQALGDEARDLELARAQRRPGLLVAGARLHGLLELLGAAKEREAAESPCGRHDLVENRDGLAVAIRPGMGGGKVEPGPRRLPD